MNAALAPPPGLVRCPACFSMLPGPWLEEEENGRTCTRCGSTLRISVFPALRKVEPVLAQTGIRALEGEATCFFHPEKRAEHSCDRCGRFVCALCDLPLGARHLCPSCLKSGDPQDVLPELVSKRVSWGRLSVMVGLVPYFPLFWFFTFFTGPLTVFLALCAFARPGSLVRGKRPFAAIFGLLLGLGQIAIAGFLVYAMWKGATHRAF